MVLDACMLLFIALCGWMGWKRGFIPLVFRFFSWILTIGISYFFSGNVVVQMKGTLLYSSLQQEMESRIQALGAQSTDQLIEQFQTAAAGKPEGFIGKLLFEGIQNGELISLSGVYQYLSIQITDAILQVLCFVLTLVIVTIAVQVVYLSVKNLLKLPILKQIDRSLGLFFGCVQGIAISYVLVMLMILIQFDGLVTQLSESYIASVFQLYSPL